MTIAFIFPGQGAQFIGMGKDWYEAFPSAKSIFDEVDDVLNYQLSDIIFNSNDINLTANAQPGIMVTSMAIYKMLMRELGKPLSDVCAVVAGHSLGEYSALCAANAITLYDTALLLNERGAAMQEAVPINHGAMAALLGIEMEGAEQLIAEASKYGVCAIANDNCVGQIVISGTKEAIAYAETIAQQYGCKKTIKLSVSAPFHCPLMEPAAKRLSKMLSKTSIVEPTVPVIANYDVTPHQGRSATANLLIKQIPGMVRWRETIIVMSEVYGINTFVEIGPGKVLSGLIKRILPDANCVNLQFVNDLDGVAKLLRS